MASEPEKLEDFPLIVEAPIAPKDKRMHPKLPFALAGATVIAFIVTVVSTMLYVASGTITTDLSRPGYERVRKEVKSPKTEQIYDTTSPVTAKAIDEFMKDYTKRVQALNGYSNFSGTALDDNDLQLAPGAPSN